MRRMASWISLRRSLSARLDIYDALRNLLSNMRYPDRSETIRSQYIHLFAQQAFKILYKLDEPEPDRMFKLHNDVYITGLLRLTFSVRNQKSLPS